jgi:citrate synthase
LREDARSEAFRCAGEGREDGAAEDALDRALTLHADHEVLVMFLQEISMLEIDAI